jgi:fructose-bisphosphate aldolase, class I
MCHDLESTAMALVAEGKGILAADETVPTLTKRFDALSIPSTEQSRRTYREMFFTSIASLGPGPGTSASPTGARSRMRHSRRGTAGRRP